MISMQLFVPRFLGFETGLSGMGFVYLITGSILLGIVFVFAFLALLIKRWNSGKTCQAKRCLFWGMSIGLVFEVTYSALTFDDFAHLGGWLFVLCVPGEWFVDMVNGSGFFDIRSRGFGGVQVLRATANILFYGLVFIACEFPLRYVSKVSPPEGSCSKCKYSLTGNESGVCPECGTRIECRSCGYDLKANSSGVCPECGTDIDPPPAKADDQPPR